MQFAGIDFDLSEDDFMRAREDDPLKDAIWERPIPSPMVNVCYENALDFADRLTIDGRTETFAYVAGGFVLGDLIEALVERRKLSVKHLHIQMLSLNDENIDSLVNVCVMSNVQRLDLILSGYWYATELKKGGLVSYLFDQLDIEGLELNVAIAEIHCKIVAIETWKGNTLTIHGSANLRSNANVEQLAVTPDRGLYNFVTDVGNRIIGAYGILLKEKRKYKSRRLMGGALWHAVTTPEAEEQVVAAESVAVEAETAKEQETEEAPSPTEDESHSPCSRGQTISPSEVDDGSG